MKFNEYSYDVSGDVTFTGRDLFLLHESCLAHYDWVTQTIFKPAHPGDGRGFGYGWMNRFSWEAEPENGGRDVLIRHPTATLDTRVTTRQLDALMKGLEMGQHLPGDQAADAAVLLGKLHALFLLLQEEWKRLNYTPYEIEVQAERAEDGGVKVFTVGKGSARVDHKVLHGGKLWLVLRFGDQTEDSLDLVVREIQVDEHNRILPHD